MFESRTLHAAGLVIVLLVVSCGLEATPPINTASPSAPSSPDNVAVPEPSAHLARSPAPSPALPPQVDERVVRSGEPRIERTATGLVSRSGSRIPVEVRSAHLNQMQRMQCGDGQVDYPQQFDDWHRIDLDGDGAFEYLVFLTLEGFGGGNNYSRYLVVYRYVEPVWFASTVLLVGGKGNVEVSGSTLRLINADLSTRALFYAPHDAMCCASVPGELHFRVAIGSVLEPIEAPLSDVAAAYRFLLMYIAPCNN
jgi:hypothetical protein